MKVIDSEELIATLHNTAFKDGDDREIVYGIIYRMANEDVISDTLMKLEAECRDLKEKLHEADLAIEHNRKIADEEQLRGELRYRDGVINGLKFAIKCNGVSGGEVS